MNAGYTLLELLLASSLGSLLIIMLMTSYSLIAKRATFISQLDATVTDASYILYFLDQHFDDTQSFDHVFALNEKNFPFLQLIKGSEGVGLVKSLGGTTRNEYFYLSKSVHHDSAFYFKEDDKSRIMIAGGVIGMWVLYGIKCHYSNNICDYVVARQLRNDEVIRSVKIVLTMKVNAFEQRKWQAYFALRYCQARG